MVSQGRNLDVSPAWNDPDHVTRMTQILAVGSPIMTDQEMPA